MTRVENETTTDAPLTVLDRMLAGKMTRERIDDHLRAGTIVLEGEVVTDLEQPAPWPAKWWLVSR